jgi:hypothetical protein
MKNSWQIAFQLITYSRSAWDTLSDSGQGHNDGKNKLRFFSGRPGKRI